MSGTTHPTTEGGITVDSEEPLRPTYYTFEYSHIHIGIYTRGTISTKYIVKIEWFKIKGIGI